MMRMDESMAIAPEIGGGVATSRPVSSSARSSAQGEPAPPTPALALGGLWPDKSYHALSRLTVDVRSVLSRHFHSVSEHLAKLSPSCSAVRT